MSGATKEVSSNSTKTPEFGCPKCGVDAPGGDSPPERTVTLVHGTWREHAKWMRSKRLVPDGRPSIADSLLKIPGTALYRFCWRGRNRHGDRVIGAQGLKRHLSDVLDRFPNAEHFVVAHSHGGNVALHAVQELDSPESPDEDSLSDNSKTRPKLRIATLGTPFLSMVARPLPGYILAFAGMVLAAVLVIGTAFLLSDVPTETLRYRVLLRLWAAMILSVLVASVIVGWSRLAYRRVSAAPLLEVEEQAANVSSPAIDTGRLFVVRAQADEAAGAFAASQLFAWVLEKLLADKRLQLWLLSSVVALAAVVGIVLAIATGGGLATLDSALGWGFYISGAIVVCGGSLLVLSYVPFGLDLIFWSPTASITAGPSPLGQGGKSFQAGRADAGVLSHGVYDNPEVIAALVEWIEDESPASDTRGEQKNGT